MKRTLVIAVLLAVASGLIWRLSRPQARQSVAGAEPPPEEPLAFAEQPLLPALPVEAPEAGRQPATQPPRPIERPDVERPVPAAPVARANRVPIEGLLIVPEAWERPHVRVELRIVSLESAWSESRVLDPLPHAPEFFPFAFLGLPGEYRLQVPELDRRADFVVGPGGRTDLRIEVAAPRIVLVRAFDATSGAERTPAEVGVRWVQGKDERRTAREAEWDPVRGAWRIVAARGALDLTARGAGYLETRQHVEDSEEPREVRLELAAAYELVLELRRDGAVVSWDPSLRPRLVPAGGQPDHVSVALADNRCRLVQRAGGPYLLEVDTPAGYRTIAPVLLELGRQHTHHVVELVAVR